MNLRHDSHTLASATDHAGTDEKAARGYCGSDALPSRRAAPHSRGLNVLPHSPEVSASDHRRLVRREDQPGGRAHEIAPGASLSRS